MHSRSIGVSKSTIQQFKKNLMELQLYISLESEAHQMNMICERDNDGA